MEVREDTVWSLSVSTSALVDHVRLSREESFVRNKGTITVNERNTNRDRGVVDA